MTKTFTPDKGWAWMVLLAAFLSNVTFDGIIFSFGVFYVEFLQYFQEGRGMTSWIGSVISGTYALVGPVASILVNKFGCRAVTMAGSLITAIGFVASTFSPNVYAMIVAYGIFGGVGFGLMYLSAYVMIGHYFDKRRALATGIASCGSGVGTFIFAPLSVWLIHTFSWKGGMLIIAGLVLNGLVYAMIFRPLPAETDSCDPDKKKKLLDITLLKTPSFLIFCFSSFLCLIGFFVPFIYLPDLIRKTGVTDKHKTAMVLSIIGITNTIGRVLCGWVADKPWADPLKIYNGALIIGGVTTMSVSWMNSYALLATYSAVFGLCIAAYVSLCAIVLVEFLGLEKLSNSFGFLNMFRGIATFIGAPLAGFLHDATGDYDLAFYVAGSAIAGAGVICLPLRMLVNCSNSNAKLDGDATCMGVEDAFNMEKIMQVEEGDSHDYHKIPPTDVQEQTVRKVPLENL